jgi:hypothetical protein
MPIDTKLYKHNTLLFKKKLDIDFYEELKKCNEARHTTITDISETEFTCKFENSNGFVYNVKKTQ